MEWLSTFIFASVEWLDKVTDSIGNNMGKFFFILLLFFLGLLLWPTKEVPPEQRGVISQEKQDTGPDLHQRFKAWLIEHTPKN